MADVCLHAGEPTAADVRLRDTTTCGGGGPVNYDVDLSETVTLSESLAVVYAAIVSLADAIALGESQSVVYNARPAPSEAVAIAESVAVIAAFRPALNESVSLAESLAVIAAFSAALNEAAISLAESIAVVAAFQPALSESVSLAELLAMVAGYTAALSETSLLTEQLTVVAQSQVALTESSGIGDALAAQLDAFIDAIETIDTDESLGVTGTITIAAPGVSSGYSARYPGFVRYKPAYELKQRSPRRRLLDDITEEEMAEVVEKLAHTSGRAVFTVVGATPNLTKAALVGAAAWVAADIAADNIKQFDEKHKKDVKTGVLLGLVKKLLGK